MGWKSCEYDGDKLTNVLSICTGDVGQSRASNPDPRGRVWGGHSWEMQTNIVCRFCAGMPDVA